MASLINVRLNRGDASPWGFRLQGGKDFGTPLLIQKVNGNSLAEKAGLQVGDAVIRVNGTDVFNLRHKDAQDIIVRGGNNIEVTVQRGGNATWKPAITPVGSTPTPSSHLPSKPSPVTKTSLAAGRPQAPSNIGSAHNLAPRPFNSPQMNGEPVKSIVNKQYNTPVNIYSEETIAETLSAQAEVLAGGVLGVNFKKNEKGYDAEKSEVFKMVQEAEKEPKSPEPVEAEQGGVVVPPPFAGLRHVSAPEPKPAAPSTPSGGSTGGQNLCAECERLIVGVFVRIKDKNLHVECFKCATCGSSLKNVGYYNINNKLYCDIHAKMVARQNPPAPNLDPITVPPGGRAPAGTISAALSSTTAPSVGPQSPQPSTIAPMPFHQQSSPSTPVTSAPKPFGSVSAPAPFTPPAAPPAPAAPFYTKQQPELPPSDMFMWPPKQDETQPVATATPLYIPPPAESETAVPTEKSPPEKSSPEDPVNSINKEKRMSICSEEICELSDERKTLKSDTLLSLAEESSDRPESPVPFNKQDSVDSTPKLDSVETSPKQDSVDSTPKQEWKTLDFSVKNFEVQDKKSDSSITQNLTAESLQVRAQQGASSSQNVEISEKDGVTRTRKVKVEESFSHSSTSYASVRSSKTVSRCITPEICEIMDKPRGSPSLVPPGMDRPTTPQQVISFPPEIPAFIPLPRSRTGTPQPHALQRILSEELGLKPQQPPVPVEELMSEKTEAPELLYTKSQVDEIVQKELQKFKSDEIKSYSTSKSEEVKLDSSRTVQDNGGSKIDASKQTEEQSSFAQSATSITQRFEIQTAPTNIENNFVNSYSSLKSDVNSQEKSSTVSTQESISTTIFPKTSTFLKKDDRPYSPVQPPQAIMRPKPQLVPLPVETKPYVPPPPVEEEKPKVLSREEICQSPMVAALTVAPKRPYSPLPVPTFKPISLDDLPSPPEGSQPLSLLSALTIAPDTPYTPFPEPVDVSKQSPPKFTSTFNSEHSKPSSIQKSIPPTVIASSNKIISSKASSYNESKSTTKVANESAFKPVQKPIVQSQPQPLPLPETLKISQSIPSQNFPPVSDELKSVFSSKSQSTSQQSASSGQSYASSAVSSSPSGIRKPDLIPYYQQNIGEIPLAHRPQSPVPHVIKAPAFRNSAEPKRSVSEQIKSSAGYSRSSGYVSSSIYGQTFTTEKQEIKSFSSSVSSGGGGGGSDNLLPYYQQNIGEIPLAHRPKSPVPHVIKAPSIDPVKPARPASTPIKPSPLAGKAPETLSRSKQVFKPEMKYQNVFAAPPEPPKPLQKTLPHFSHPTTATEKQPLGAPWIVKKQDDLHTQQKSSFSQPKESPKFQSPVFQPKTPPKPTDPTPQTKITVKLPDFKSGAISSPQSNPQTNHKPATGFTPPSQNKSSVPPTTSDPPAGAGGPGNKGATFAGSSAPRRGRGTLNPSVGPGARIPLCGSCSRQIRGPFITALGKIWCPEHFICANAQCRRPLQDIGFVEENTGLYCEFCFEQYLAPNCNKCGSKIKGDCLNAIGKHFHPECFCCAYCGKLFGNSPFFLEDALPYCENDWNELFTTKCFSCGFPIEAGDRWVEALSNNYHSQCFNCTMCKKNLEGQSFYAKGGRPFCKNHAR